MSPVELPAAAPTPLPVQPPPGVPAAPRPEQRFRVEGMDCAACARTVDKAVAAPDGVTAARASSGAGTLAAEGSAPVAAVTAAVSPAGGHDA